jgi:hypothetical protein
MNSQRHVRFTKLGVVAVAIMVAIWVGGIAYGHVNPSSLLGQLINAQFGFAIYIFVVGAIFSGIGAVFGACGKPFIAKGP